MDEVFLTLIITMYLGISAILVTVLFWPREVPHGWDCCVNSYQYATKYNDWRGPIAFSLLYGMPTFLLIIGIADELQVRKINRGDYN